MKLEHYLQKHYTPKTAKAYSREIEIYTANNPQSASYTYSDIVQYIGALRKRYSNAKTINRIVSSIKAYYSYLCYTGTRNDNPSQSIKLRDKQNRAIQLQDLFTPEELEHLLNAKQERYTKLSYRNKVLMSLLIYQGLKPDEIARLTVADINLEQATLYIQPSAKSNSRTLALKANQILLFKYYMEEIRPQLLSADINTTSTKMLLIGQRKQPMSGEDITKHIKRNYALYTPRKVTCQTIRQSVITNLLKQQHDLRLVQSFAGHKYPSTTERYKQTHVTALKEQLDKHHPMR
jgi:integrase/recombinase XerD